MLLDGEGIRVGLGLGTDMSKHTETIKATWRPLIEVDRSCRQLDSDWCVCVVIALCK